MTALAWLLALVSLPACVGLMTLLVWAVGKAWLASVSEDEAGGDNDNPGIDFMGDGGRRLD